MTHAERAKAYKAFFADSVAGEEFMKQLDQLIDAAHENAEKDPKLARDFTQHARGIRQVKEYITGAMAEINRGKHA